MVNDSSVMIKKRLEQKLQATGNPCDRRKGMTKCRI